MTVWKEQLCNDQSGHIYINKVRIYSVGVFVYNYFSLKRKSSVSKSY